MQAYDYYGNKVGKRKIVKDVNLNKMKENKFLLIDDLNFEERKKWVDIFGKLKPYHYLTADEINGFAYIVRNIVTGFIYIGQTSDIIKRKSQHLSALKNIKHENSDMQIDALLFGLDKFIFGILEFDIQKDKLLERERYWIKYFESEYPNGYNAPYNKNVDFGMRDSKKYIEELIRMKDARESKSEHFDKLKESVQDKILDKTAGSFWGSPKKKTYRWWND